MFDLDDHVGFELPVEGMKDVICGSGAIIFWVAPIEMMVIDKGAIKKETVVRCQGTSNSVSSVGGGAAVGGWAGLAFGIGFDCESGEVRDFPIDLVCFLFPPIGNPRIERIECFETADRFGAAEVKDRKSTRLNSSHANISYAVFCLKKKKDDYIIRPTGVCDL